MEDIGVLEKRVFGKPKTATGEDLMRLARHYFEKFQAEKDYRVRQKLVNHAGFFAGWAAKTKTLNKEELDECIKILRSAERGESVQAYLPMAITEWLKVQGAGEPQIITEKRGGVAVESGVIGVGDPTKGIRDGEDYMDDGLAKLEAEGRNMYIHTGGDGHFDIKLRVVTGPEPVLPAAEYKKIIGSQEAKISIESGKVAVADMWGAGDEKWAMTMEVENGTYKIAAYMFDTAKFFGYVIVMCKA